MSAVRVPVLIVGAGAAGLATSALLAKHGVSSLLVEKRREIFIYPKARNLSFRSLEILRGLGLGDQVHAIADRVSDMVVKPTLNSAEEDLAIDIDAFFAGLDQLSPEPAVQPRADAARRNPAAWQRSAVRDGVAFVRTGRHRRHSGAA